MGVHYKYEPNYRARENDHFCPLCKEKLIVEEVSRIVGGKSSDAGSFIFPSMPDTGNAITDMRIFTWDVFYCEKCDADIEIEDIWRLAYEKKDRWVD